MTFGRGIDFLIEHLGPSFPLSQVKLLLEVAKLPGQTQNELSRRVGVSPTAITRASRTLERKLGLLETRYDVMDERIKLIHLTPSGREFVKDLLTAARGGNSRPAGKGGGAT